MIEIDASAAQNEMPAAIKKSIPRLTLSEKNISRPFKTLAPKIAGIANNNEKTVFKSLFNVLRKHCLMHFVANFKIWSTFLTKQGFLFHLKTEICVC